MTELKRICPFCGGEMIGTNGHPICHYNPDCVIHDESVPQELLDLLADTKKKLDLAITELKNVVEDDDFDIYMRQLSAQTTLEQINQKEEQ